MPQSSVLRRTQRLPMPQTTFGKSPLHLDVSDRWIVLSCRPTTHGGEPISDKPVTSASMCAWNPRHSALPVIYDSRLWPAVGKANQLKDKSNPSTQTTLPPKNNDCRRTKSNLPERRTDCYLRVPGSSRNSTNPRTLGVERC